MVCSPGGSSCGNGWDTASSQYASRTCSACTQGTMALELQGEQNMFCSPLRFSSCRNGWDTASSQYASRTLLTHPGFQTVGLAGIQLAWGSRAEHTLLEFKMPWVYGSLSGSRTFSAQTQGTMALELQGKQNMFCSPQGLGYS